MGIISGLKNRKHAHDVAAMVGRAKRIESLFDKEMRRIGVDAKSDEVTIYFKRLGIRRTSDKSRIHDAYIKQMKEWHPDVSSKEGAQEKAKELNEAYTVLSGKDLGRALNIGPEAGKQKKGVAERIIKEYNAVRKRDYAQAVADMRSRSSSYEEALRRLSNWEERYDRTCNALFGKLWRIGAELRELSERNAAMLRAEKDANAEHTLEESLRKIEGVHDEYRAAEAMLSDVIGSIEQSIASSETEAFRRSRR